MIWAQKRFKSLGPPGSKLVELQEAKAHDAHECCTQQFHEMDGRSSRHPHFRGEPGAHTTLHVFGTPLLVVTIHAPPVSEKC